MVNRVVLILGYNNTRIRDVKKIRQKVAENLQAMTMLCKESIDDQDKQAVDITLRTSLHSSTENIKKIIEFCRQKQLKIVAVLPFSDKGTQLGASLASYLGLPGANPKQISAALNKYEFRVQEQLNEKPSGYLIVNSKKIASLEALKQLFKQSGTGLFVKPVAEGNSRGCIAIQSYQDCELAWRLLKSYVSSGIVAEDLIKGAQEYSYEHVAGYSWITEKITTNNQYRAEPQHIMPAPLAKNQSKLLVSGGRFISEICGAQGGACHNELFLDIQQNKVMAVEPNLRPAGGKIWDMCSYAFENFDPWETWILWAAGKLDSTPKPLKQKSFAGMRFITAKQDGRITKIKINCIDQLRETLARNVVEIVWTKSIGDSVVSCPRDNSDFIGHIIAKAETYDELATIMNSAVATLEQNCEIDTVKSLLDSEIK